MSAAGPVATVLAFDYGGKRIGVAVGNAMLESSNPLTTLHRSGAEPDWDALAALIKEWGPDLLLVGLPLLLDDTPSANAIEAEAFARRLGELSQREVLMVDEKLSSAAAREEIRQARQAGLRKRTRPGDIDKFAAQVILRTWLHQRNGRPPQPAEE